MNISKTSIIITIIIMFLSLFAGVFYKTMKDYRAKLYLVSEKRIVEAVKKCLNEDLCKKSTVTLKELYYNGYLKKEINPVTKEVYSDKSYVSVDDGYKFIPLY